MRRIVVAIVLAISLAGCGSIAEFRFGSKKPQMSWVAVRSDGTVVAGLRQEIKTNEEAQQGDNTSLSTDLIPESDVRGYVITWPAEFNGAFVNSKGVGCIQPAAYVSSSDVEIGLPASIIESGLTGKLELDSDQQITHLMQVSQEQTRLSIMMFGICQLVVTDGLKPDEAAEAVKKLIATLGKTGDSKADPTPEPTPGQGQQAQTE